MSRKRQNADQLEDDFQVRTLAVGYASGYVISSHAHGWGQLIYASKGVMSVHTASGSWVVPPHRAVWVPAGVNHKIEMSGEVSMRTLYFAPDLSTSLPKDCCVISVTPLLRELILHTVKIGMLNRNTPEHERLSGVILDQLQTLPIVALQIQMPRDRRAFLVAESLRNDPGRADALDQLAREAGATKRTIERLFLSETAMTFGQWRQQLRLLHALRLLASGEPVTNVALAVGYESASAFIAMFKRELGVTPSRYYTDKQRI
jgi:AraC-like DNA-binding protein/quercetin dioxygenase-like cupin family protein